MNFVDLLFVDIDGMRKAVSMPYERYAAGMKEAALKKAEQKDKEDVEFYKWFDGSSIAGFNSIENSDMRLKPDENTFHVLPWTESPFETAVVLCDVLTKDGEPYTDDPKQMLKNILERYKKNGWLYKVGSEVEFFILKKDGDRWVPHDAGEYFHFKPGDEGERMRQEICNYLFRMGVKPEAHHHEVAPGQHEIAIEFDDAEKSALNIYLLKMTIEYVASQHGYRATFMPKPFAGMNGSGMHTHQSVSDLEGKNLFYNPEETEKDKSHLSDLAKKFMAGQLKYLENICVFIAPTVNSYKRLVPGYEAPVYVCWGKQNRSAALRLPAMTKEEMEKGMRVELRCPDPSCNPYIAYTAMAMAGFEGMNGAPGMSGLPAPIEESSYKMSADERSARNIDSLPGNLDRAMTEANICPLSQLAFTESFMRKFSDRKRAEWRDYHSFQVTPWEIEKYL